MEPASFFPFISSHQPSLPLDRRPLSTIEPPDRRSQKATVLSRSFFGHDQLVELRLPSGSVVRARRLGFPAWHPGDNVRVWIEGPADVLARDA